MLPVAVTHGPVRHTCRTHGPDKKEAASAGVLDTPFGKFARLQIITIEDLFAGKKPAMPPEDPAAFRKAAREGDKTRQGKLI